MKAKYEGACAICNGGIHKGDEITWDKERREACHTRCAEKQGPVEDPAYDANAAERWERIKRINRAALARQRRDGQTEINDG